MIGWLDAGAGASGDMLLGALLGAGVPLPVLADAVTAVTGAAGEAVTLEAEQVDRAGFTATRCHVRTAETHAHRTWRDVRGLLEAAGLAAGVRERALAAFTRLAEAEAAVHGTAPDDVGFHEVGALDAIADVVGASAGLEHLALDDLVVSPVAVGSGSVDTAHGPMTVPPPAVTTLLTGVASLAGPASFEACTPTGAALLTASATAWGPQPAMTTTAVGVGAGGRDPASHANVLRLLIGEPAVPRRPEGERGALLLEANVDDLDPRLWPPVLAALLEAGASDAWLTPILMKKGRPAHTLSVLVRGEPVAVAAVRREVFRQTSTIGLREQPVGKTALAREMVEVDVAGHRVRVKLARLDGELLNAMPEYEDVAEVARATGRPVKTVLAHAIAATVAAQEETSR